MENDLRMGKIDFNGIQKRVCLEHVPQARPGEYVLVHVGVAGRDSGRMPGYCDWCFTVPSFSIHRIQETHETLLHVL